MAQLRLALALPLLAGSFGSAPAQANDLGCQVLLCLSNPGGATQYGACVPPMTELWRKLAMGGSFPGCSGSGVAKTKVLNRNSSTHRRVVMTYQDGTQQTYSLANIENLPPRIDVVGGTRQ